VVCSGRRVGTGASESVLVDVDTCPMCVPPQPEEALVVVLRLLLQNPRRMYSEEHRWEEAERPYNRTAESYPLFHSQIKSVFVEARSYDERPVNITGSYEERTSAREAFKIKSPSKLKQAGN